MDAFTKATRQVLQNTAFVDPVMADVTQGIPQDFDIFVSGTFGMIGEKNISILIGFSKKAIYTIYTSVFSEDPSEITFSSIGDLVGEMTNMISGSARNTLSQQGLNFKSSIPSVVIGMRQYVHHPAGTVTSVIPFSIDDGPFFVEISIK